jgi:hypothetical protein
VSGKSALDKIGEQRLAGCGILGGSLPQPQDVLLAARVDADRG